ncbi:helix-turn-helix domain-containing protein [Streptomyces sp. NBC_01237]|uniref:helix-turn-helix domain-containing protein n=1 Tax=Streptomyces sp. NBC_01237 TaxID=2903790 RepID=UPI002DDC5ECB|nr:helix-turn-helix transcriptional regulator [Streptomyces sp. NBC_01237]WRZ77274.1 helix-turn-helix domain-containing protein [Streptomyces sp. NBC_01237]
MGKPVGVTIHKIELGARLCQLRKAAGLTQAQASEAVRPQVSTLNETRIQRIEKGKGVFRMAPDLHALISVYGVEDGSPVIEELTDLHKKASSDSWLTLHRDHLLPDMEAFVGLEAEATTLRVYHPTVIHGLLQAEEYAQALYESQRPIEDTTASFIRGHVEVRMQRKKESILRAPDPVRLWVVLGEAALLNPLGTPDVMRAQYVEIARLAAMDHVQVQVLRTTAKGRKFAHNFTIMDLDDPLTTTVATDTAWGAISMSSKRSEVERFTAWFNSMTASAEPPEETPTIMQDLIREIDKHEQ